MGTRDARRGRRLALLALWVVALGLRILFFRGLEVEETLRADGARYAALAWNLANHGVYAEEPAPPWTPHMRWPPGYPLLLAPSYRGRDVAAGTLAALRVQVLVGSTLPLLVVAVGGTLLPPGLAWLAGVLTALCPVLVTTPAFLVSETYYSVGLFLVIALLRLLIERPARRLAILTGIACGSLALVRSSALGLPAAVAGLLVARERNGNRWRAAVLLVVAALLVTLPWETRTRIEAARGVPAPSYFARPLAEGIYPDLRYGQAARGYAFLADPRFPEFSTSITKTLAELWRRTREDPWPNIRWNLWGRWLTLWDFHMVQSPPIHIYPVKNGLFRPASLSPDGRDEPLAPVYWLFRTLYYWFVVPLSLAGAAIVVARRRGPSSDAARLRELLYVLLAYTVVLHGVLSAEPRFMIPVRPVLFLLALATAVDAWAWLAARRAARAPLARAPGARAIAANLALVLGGVAVSLGLVEGGCRLFLADRLTVATDERNLLYRYDPTLGWFPRASEERRFLGEREIDVRHNARGFRDVELAAAKSGRPRLAVFGDSFVWGYDVQVGERFTDLLAARHPEWEVMNCGVSGYGTDQELLLFERIAAALRPEVVVLEFNPVDRGDNRLAVNHGGYGKPIFRVDGDALDLENVPVPLLGKARWADSALYRQSYAWRLVVGGAAAPSALAPVDPTERLVDRMQEESAAFGARFVILLEGVDDAMRAHAAAREIPVVEVEPALRARAAAGIPLRYPGHGFHWTPEGHRIVAALLEPVLAGIVAADSAAPTSAAGWVERGRRFEAQEAWSEAAAAYDRALALDPADDEAAMLAGLAYHYRLRDDDRAIARYRAILARSPSHYGARYQLAVALLAHGETDAARAAWGEFVVLADAIGDRRAIEEAPAALREAEPAR
jgi:lysophospholipase L1-like esterase